VERHVEQARAKVNLWLTVVGRRDDGYHLLDSLVVFSDLADTLEAEPADELSLAIEGLGADSLSAEPDNLVLKAARLLAAEVGAVACARLRLTKRIPMAAGLGGGSADAAAALRLLCRLWRLDLPASALLALGTRLGADVPMCLAERPMLVGGIGEKLAPAPPLPACSVLLVNPRVALPTPKVFAARSGAFSRSQVLDRPWSDLDDLAAALAARGNDLTDAAVSLQPVVGEVLGLLRHAPAVRYAGMSGSGATCFALCRSLADAESTAGRLPSAWWRHVGRLV
jgi:4-diphosphocytidyl-2-C-methyl-D-erythritol kinase